MPAALIQPAVPPPTMTTRNGGDRLSRMASPIDPQALASRVMILDAGSRASIRISELDADTHLVAPINPRPARIPENRFGSRGCCGIAKYLLLVRRPDRKSTRL